MIFKICGLKNKESLLCCEENNTDFFGMIFYEKSPRNITFNEANILINTSKNLRIKPVGVFVDHEINDLKKIISSLRLKHIQLHGSESQLYIDEIKNQFDVKIIKKISINNSEDLNINNKFNFKWAGRQSKKSLSVESDDGKWKIKLEDLDGDISINLSKLT